jgi:hypothetical protein
MQKLVEKKCRLGLCNYKIRRNLNINRELEEDENKRTEDKNS